MGNLSWVLVGFMRELNLHMGLQEWGLGVVIFVGFRLRPAMDGSAGVLCNR